MPAPAAMTELDAVNMMLEAIGELPVASLIGPAVDDVGIAVNSLKQSLRLILSKGKSFNTDYGFVLSPDVGGFISVPIDAISIDADSDERECVMRGSKLWDSVNNTYVWTLPLSCTIIRYMAFEDLPPTVREFVALSACRVFLQKRLPNPTLDAMLAQQQQEALIVLGEDELSQGDWSMLTDMSVQNAIARSGGF